jgi:hypothetical protein
VEACITHILLMKQVCNEIKKWNNINNKNRDILPDDKNYIGG